MSWKKDFLLLIILLAVTFGIANISHKKTNIIKDVTSSSNIDLEKIHNKNRDKKILEKKNTPYRVRIGKYSKIFYPYNIGDNPKILEAFLGKDFVPNNDREKINKFINRRKEFIIKLDTDFYQIKKEFDEMKEKFIKDN